MHFPHVLEELRKVDTGTILGQTIKVDQWPYATQIRWKDLCCAPVLYLNYNLFSTKIIKLNGLTLEFEIIHFRTKVLMHRMCVIPDHIVLAHRYDFCILMIKFDISFPHGCTYFTVVFFVTGVLLCSDRDLCM